MDIKLISLILMAIFYMYAGFSHFRNPRFFLRITPPYVPFPKTVNFIVGVAEMSLGMALLFPETSVYAAYGIIALLIAVFPANIYHLQSKGAGMKIPMWGLWLRLPIQGVFLLWAYWHTF